jgi:stage II sporulation protein AB (anti-sigma F factor)
MVNNEMHLDFLSISANEAFARGVISVFAAQLNPTVEELTDVRTAVSEAVTNAIIHGYDGQFGYVTLNAKIEDELLTVQVIDKGVGIADVKAAREPFFTSRPDLERSGMGFTVMETFMDEVYVQSELGAGTTITMKKKIGSREWEDVQC